MENTDYNAGHMSEAPHTDEEKNMLIGNLIRSLLQAKHKKSGTLEIQTDTPGIQTETVKETSGHYLKKATAGTSSSSTNKGGCLSAVAIMFMAATGAIISAFFL